MPWSQTSPMDQKTLVIAAYLRGARAMTELCEYGISRKTGYKWIDRYMHRPQGLEERSRRPRASPRHNPDQVVTAIIELRRHPSWGAKKIFSVSTRHPRWPGLHADGLRHAQPPRPNR